MESAPRARGRSDVRSCGAERLSEEGRIRISKQGRMSKQGRII